VENYEYELPSDFEDEEIDEDLAFTAEDKERFAGWFGGDEGGATAAAGGRSGAAARGEFADLDSSEEGSGSEGEEGLDEEVRLWLGLLGQGASRRRGRGRHWPSPQRP
jgi:U3 small nucleolar RNA-associated protein 14